MSGRTPVAELLFRAEDAAPMSLDEATVRPWSQARTALESTAKGWLSTVRPDGRPHVAPVMPVWADDAPCFTTRPGSRKGRNLAGTPACALSVAAADLDLDLVLEGDAVRLRDPALLRRVADALAEKYRWELTIRDGTVRDPGLPGEPEYAFYRITVLRGFGYGADGSTATRWRFDRTG
ncbi:pyridoxamine 5'-phosphate oxidase [Plantactinospora sp. BC1]|uniref:pyridoxamine 5'-phosphate oxidase family protein n=1 Tax=Plantactinospora sp. BC1 TaxID=2108470 RepID=UPI000D16237A|nr:pyridoxamine 5'-phosphate oxidase family protein [Plantactinospora sp. BC1]AVT28791.1 pyridoxamine 5'-phosphate oxidase [Plantactinospora sp. BC1]